MESPLDSFYVYTPFISLTEDQIEEGVEFFVSDLKAAKKEYLLALIEKQIARIGEPDYSHSLLGQWARISGVTLKRLNLECLSVKQELDDRLIAPKFVFIDLRLGKKLAFTTHSYGLFSNWEGQAHALTAVACANDGTRIPLSFTEKEYLREALGYPAKPSFGKSIHYSYEVTFNGELTAGQLMRYRIAETLSLRPLIVGMPEWIVEGDKAFGTFNSPLSVVAQAGTMYVPLDGFETKATVVADSFS